MEGEECTGRRILKTERFPEDLPNPGSEPRSPALQVDSLPSEPVLYSRFLLAIYFI